MRPLRRQYFKGVHINSQSSTFDMPKTYPNHIAGTGRCHSSSRFNFLIFNGFRFGSLENFYYIRISKFRKEIFHCTYRRRRKSTITLRFLPRRISRHRKGVQNAYSLLWCDTATDSAPQLDFPICGYEHRRKFDSTDILRMTGYNGSKGTRFKCKRCVIIN